jgi:hypothetical protein
VRFRRREPDQPAALLEPVDAVFSGVLDGRRLWVAVAHAEGRFALRTASGELHEAPAVDDSHDGHRSARLDLADLPAGAYDVVLAAADGVRPVRSDAPPRRTPTSPGTGMRHRLERVDDGALRLVTEPVPPAAELVAVSAGPDGLLVTTDPVGPLHLLADDTVVATATDGLLHEALVADLDAQLTRVVVGDDRLPVRRRDDDLADPGRGAPLPGDGRLRLRWSPRGLLQARITEREDP